VCCYHARLRCRNMWLLHWCKLSKFLIIAVTVSSAVVIVDSSARKRWTNQVNSTSTNESKTMQIVKDEFLSSTDGPLKSNRSTVDQEWVYRNHESLYLQNESSRNFTKEVLSDAEVDSNAVWPYFYTGCLEWLPINHVYFQLANSFLFLSYFAPAGLKGLIFLRLMLAIGSAFLSIWGWIIICAFDTFLWNALFFVINAVHAVVLLISLRPVALDEQLEQVRTTQVSDITLSEGYIYPLNEVMTAIVFLGVQKPFQAPKGVEAAIQKSGEKCHVHPTNQTRRIFCRRARNSSGDPFAFTIWNV
jgi:hypothetical protein